MAPNVLSRAETDKPLLLLMLQRQEKRLQQAYQHFSGSPQDSVVSSYAAEWLLDNYFIVQQAIRQIREDMPTGYYRQLPKLTSGNWADYPRIYSLAHDLITTTHGRLNIEDAVQHLQTFQSANTPLTMGEIWAFPTMLRLGILDGLADTLMQVIAPPTTTAAPASVDDTLIGNYITSLRTIATHDWKRFFELVSVVDQILRTDPADVYAAMDFDTRNTYRTVVERLARRVHQSEEAVARQAIALSQSHHTDSARNRHVGYHLVDAGYPVLEASLHYQPTQLIALGRALRARPTATYVGSILLLTLVLVLLSMGLAVSLKVGLLGVLAVGFVTLLPFSAVAVTLVNWVITHAIKPTLLPRLDFQQGVPANYKTMVVIPTLLGDVEGIDSLLQQLELHYLRNTDSNLSFALLTDYEDAPQQHMPSDEALINHARSGIDSLNAKYPRDAAPFYLFHRERQWNAQQEAWIGWERKRGKLAQFNQLLHGADVPSFVIKHGDLSVLPHIRYVITLDADSILPEDSARLLVATIAHPLNQAIYDPQQGKVVAGYGILQPRVEIKPTSANQSLFTRIFSGEVGLDLYTHAVSDVYQDLFGEGSYVGKGIYDVAAFEAATANRIPENTLLSHDLFEGLHARVGLVTDIALFEDYPARYLGHMRRLHRWVRGDWQLLPWLFPHTPTARLNQSVPTHLSLLDYWKIADNLRRSLVLPALLVFFISAWLGWFGSPLLWTLIGLATMTVPVFVTVFVGLRTQAQSSSVTLVDVVRSLRIDAWRWWLTVTFLPYEALLTLNAIGVTLWRMFVSRQHLLQWTTAASTARLFDGNTRAATFWREMLAVPALVTALTVLIGLANPLALPIAAVLLTLWFISPQIAFWISRPIERLEPELSEQEKVALRQLARQTWLFFEQMVGPEDHWLPPDHYQEAPRVQMAHRTSPTNIGMFMLSTLSAYDLGFMGPQELLVRLQATFGTLEQMEHYRGHLLNWYDTQTLEPLTPRYVSTVDSGNLAGNLIVVKQACLNLPDTHVINPQRWQGVLDTLDLVEGSLNTLLTSAPTAPVTALQAYMTSLRQRVQAAMFTPDRWASLMIMLTDDAWAELSRLIIALLTSDAATPDAEAVNGLRITSERLHHHIVNMHGDMELFLPWLLMQDLPDYFSEPPIATRSKALLDGFPASPTLRQLVTDYDTIESRLQSLQGLLSTQPASDQRHDAQAWCSTLATKLTVAKQQLTALLDGYQQTALSAEVHFRAMRFDFLYNPQRQIFYIGYNVTGERLDDNCYDLLASEARLASVLAIAKRDVPQEHWLHLGRAMTSVVNTRTLLSWSGTMFEYLMPTLIMRSYENTLLTQSDRAAVDYQISYGHERNVPWGISESSYYAFDGNMTYQYRAFGVPGLGFKRGLTEDLVIAPYASMLALSIRPHAVRHNMDRLDDINMRGRYGFYESVDFSRARLARRQEHAVIRSYMAHHQGMIMVSVTNYLLHDIMINRFHADPGVQSVEMLLQEKIPTQGPIEYPHQDELIAQTTRLTSRVSLTPWQVPVDASVPQVHVLSNGRYTTVITSAGGGYSQWNGLGLTRWQSDTTRDHWGLWLYVQDLDSGALWSVGYQPTTVTPDSQQVQFYPHQAEFQRRDQDIALHMQVTVSPDDDVEIRQLTLINHSERPRRLRIVSYSEVMLAGSESHPAFNKLFIQSEYVASNNLLLFHRRLRSADEAPIYMGHLLVTNPDDVRGRISYDADRAHFLGRGKTPLVPDALQRADSRLSQTVGITLDPVMSLSHEVTIQPHGRTRAAFLTLATTSRQAALDLATRYQIWPTITRTFDNSLRQNESMLRQMDLGTTKVAQFQQLLSMLLYPHAGLRSPADILAANSRGQSALWAYAISGDYPILLLRIRDDADMPLVQELLQAHTYWRDQQLKIDLVIVNLHDSSYSQELQGQLHRLIVRSNSATWLNQRGGIFIVNADQMSKPDLILLQTAARVVLDSQAGSLADQINRSARPSSPLPGFTPALFNADQPESTPKLPRPADLRFDNGSGGFSSDGKEYIIYLDKDQWTPVPWVNVIGYESFGFLVSETGAGYTWAGNSSQNRLTPWHNDPVSDGSGEALYVRDEETAAVWSPMPLPSRDGEPYLIQHGAGYSQFTHHSQGLKQTTQLFAAPDAPIKVIKLRLENAWNRPRRVTVTYYAEWVLETSRANAQSYVVPEYDHASGALLARNSYNAEFADRVAFLAANQSPHGLTADRTEFLGRMGTPARPAALTRIGLASRVEAGNDPCAALQLHIDLPVGGVEEVFFILGEGANKDDALALINRFRQPDQIESAWRVTHEFWDRILGAVTVHTPDPSMDIMLNRWLLYQALSCRIWGRSGFYQSSGAYGYRDQLQDVMALLHADPALTKWQILNAARHQFEAGDVLHWWHPPSGRGVRTRFSDDLLWLPFVVAHYVNTTGDYAILREEIPFLRGPGLKPDEEERYGQYETTDEKYSLYEHLIRAVKRGSTSGSHGLPLMGTGDWNDGMNRVGREGRGESVWVGWFLYSVLLSTAPLADFMEDNERAAAYRDQAQKLKAVLNTEAWDGRWYRRAYYDDKTPLGSAQNPECQIDSIAQSWAVISGAGEPQRAEQAMQSVVDRLVKEKEQLLLLFTPPFDKSPRDPGYIKGYPPGVRENGGQYTHAALWTVWAFAQMGDGDRAGSLFKLLNPIEHSDTAAKAATYKVEPYVIAADVYSVAPHTGRGGWTWYTGSASWMYRLGIEAILGIKRMGDKLIIDPCIPSAWAGYDLTYRDGEAHYAIHISNPDGVSCGVVEVVVDGKPIPELHIPLLKDGGTHEVQVRLGRTGQVEAQTSRSQLDASSAD